MGKFQAMHKYFAVFLALVACNDSLLTTHGRHIKPLNQHSSQNKGAVMPENNPLPSSQKKKVDSPKYGVTSFRDSDALADTNGFRPTTPGNSPGVGHRNFAGQDEVMEALEAVQSPDDANVYVTEGTINGFKPTNPGHSPGVGHDQQNNIGHLN